VEEIVCDAESARVDADQAEAPVILPRGVLQLCKMACHQLLMPSQMSVGKSDVSGQTCGQPTVTYHPSTRHSPAPQDDLRPKLRILLAALKYAPDCQSG
jgi:hypothetical protein